MEAVRCGVECLSEFSDCQSHSVRFIQDGTNLFLSCGLRDALMFNVEERKVTTVMQFEASVTCLALSDDKRRLYALCANSGLYCTPLPPQLSSSSVVVNKSPERVLYMVPEDSIVLKNASLQAFIIVEKILVTLSLDKSVWTFNLYEEPGSKPLHKLAHFQIATVNTCCLSTTDKDKEKSVSLPPILTCIYPEVSMSVRRGLHPHLEHRLFRLLFGVDASLVNSPVILCGLPDGRICCFPLLVPTLTGPRGERRSPIRVLQSLEQPVRFIGTCVSGEHGNECLIAVGQRGKLLVVRSKQASSEGKEAEYCFNEHSVRGPVLCACVDDKRMYYSSLNDLHALQLTTSSSSSEATGTEAQLQALTSESLGVCRIIALAEPYTNPTGSVQLLAVSLNGRLLRVTLPEASENGNVCRLPSSLAGQRVKDLLASIGNIWDRAESLKHKLQEKNESLKRLNQVINVCSLLLDSHGNEKKLNMGAKHPISCHGVARWSSLLQRDSLTLTCVLENSSGCTLEHGWTLCIQVHPLSQCPHMESSSRTYSFPFRKLDSGQKLDVTVPLESTSGLSLPVKVYCSLAFSLSSLFSPEASPGVSQLLTETASISAPLNTLTVDWLDAIRLERLFSHGNMKCNSITDGIQAFLRSRGPLTKDSDTTSKSGPISVVVRVSSELLKTKLRLSPTSSVQTCMSVLNWLVSSEAKGQTSVQSPMVCAYSPDGCSVKIMAKEVTLEDFYSEGPFEVLEIQVESTSVAAVCGLHHAILRRLQVLLRDSSVKCGNTKKLKAQSLCEAVRHVESLYKDLQDAQNQAALGGTMDTNKSSEIMLRIFLQLRANPLIIL